MNPAIGDVVVDAHDVCWRVIGYSGDKPRLKRCSYPGWFARLMGQMGEGRGPNALWVAKQAGKP